MAHIFSSIKESLTSVLPIAIIVLILSVTCVSLDAGVLVLFLFGTILLILGMSFFTIGSTISMEPLGDGIGKSLNKNSKIIMPLIICFVLGFIITISEPDLQALAEQVPTIPNAMLIGCVGVGVGIFLSITLVRNKKDISLRSMLMVFYILIIGLSFFAPDEFVATAFDSGGVTTGPMTVPFIMAFGIGISAIRNDKHAADDSFGLVSMCSIGPILAVMILGIIYNPESGEQVSEAIPDIANTVDLWKLFSTELPTYIHEIAISLFPIVGFFAFIQLFVRDINKTTIIKIIVGIVYTYIGLVLFLTGVNVGFMPAGNYLGQTIAKLPYSWIIIPIGMVIGYFIVKAEPAVFVLTKQVEELTDGAISAKAMGMSLSIGVSASVGLAMTRVLSGISILWFLVPGYLIALVLTFFVSKIFTAIAFDSGGVASGPMTATFLLPFAMGACEALGGNIVADAFGIVSMVAMTPLITIQIMGLIYKLKEKKLHKEVASQVDQAALDAYGDMEIIEL